MTARRSTRTSTASASLRSSPEPATLVVDQRVVFFIRDIPTGAILFVGRVVDPR